MQTVTNQNSIAVMAGNQTNELRCCGNVRISGEPKQCNKLLVKSNDSGIIAGNFKCPRCNTINEI